MGVLYYSSRPSQLQLTHDSFDIVNDRSSVSFSFDSRSACQSRAASSLCHSFLLVICNIGQIRKASHHQRSLPVVEDRLKPFEEGKTSKTNSNNNLVLPVGANASRRSLSCDVGTRAFDDINVGTIHHSRLRARNLSLGSLSAGATADIDTESLTKSPFRVENQTRFQRVPLREYVKDRQIAESRRDKQKSLICSFEDNLNAADVPLPPSPTIVPLVDRPKGRQQSVTSIAGSVIKRQRDDSDDDTKQGSVQFKRAMTCTQNVRISMQLHDAYGKVPGSLAELNDRTSAFDTSRWLKVDWQDLGLACFDNTRGPHSAVQVSVLGFNPDSTQALSTPVPTVGPALNRLDRSTSNSLSAIQKFNGLIGSCDASARHKQNPSQCLANNQEGKRCGRWWDISKEDQPRVRQLLEELASMNFESSSLCVRKLHELTNSAVCPSQRKIVRDKVTSLVQRSHHTGLIKYLPQFRPYRPPEAANLTANEFVAVQAAESFSVNPNHAMELGEGYVYVYWNEATFGVLKIGFTTRNVSGRLKEWEDGCRHVAAEQYSSPCKVRHAAKVEQLVHADLLDYRVLEPACRTCSKSHIEWFKGLSLSYIIGRIEAWSQWMSEGPYEQLDGQWRLTDQGRDKMPLAAGSNSGPDPVIHPKLLANRSRRYNLRKVKGRKPSP